MKKITGKERVKRYALGGKTGPGEKPTTKDLGAITPGDMLTASTYMSPVQMYAYNAFLNRDKDFSELSKGLNEIYGADYSANTANVSKDSGMQGAIAPLNNDQKKLLVNELTAYKGYKNNPQGYFKDLQGRAANDTALNELVPAVGFAMGQEYAMGGMAGGWGAAAQGGISILDALMNNPAKGYTKEPLVNVSAMRGMASPYAMGGSVPIEAEGGEVFETPGGQMGEISGPSHEEGGVDMNVPEGTQIYSDRLSIDGKTMQERKKKRERAHARLEKLADKRPSDHLLKNTLTRSVKNFSVEEAQDTALQEVAKRIYSRPGQNAMGGKASKYEGGGLVERYPQLNDNFLMNSVIDNIPVEYPSTVSGFNGNFNTPETPPVSGASANPTVGLGVGDYVGMAGSLVNTFGPIINTLKNREATLPEINRFQGFGRDAIGANDHAQDYVEGQRGNALNDIQTSANSSRIRNRNSASGVNTLRALDAITDAGSNRAKASVNDNFSREMMGILGQRSQLENIQDQVVMGGAERRDERQAQNTDNFYSNMAQNITNAGTNIQGIGRNLNVNRSNNVDLNLLNQLSKYGLGVDEDGNIISLKK